jgi:D-glycero-alpha-D-manno-heptose-7-phosphate kinase
MVITQTPLRISFAGGGTDFPEFFLQEGGAVLNAAIDKYVLVIVKERFDEKIYINYSRKEIVDSVDEIQHDLVREAMRRAGVSAGVEITTLADIPSEGSGLGSSSSITVGLLNALYIYRGIQQTAETLARDACEIEIDILKRPIGKQDQYIAAYGGLRHLIFQPDSQVGATEMKLPGAIRRELENHLMLFFTSRTRRADGILREQRDRTDANRGLLLAMREQVPRFRSALERGDFGEAGRLLHEGWELKKRLARQITDGELDALHDRALAAGALGGKIAGAGGGGFLLLLCPPQSQRRVREALADLRDLPFHLEPDGSKVIFNNRRYVWK